MFIRQRQALLLAAVSMGAFLILGCSDDSLSVAFSKKFIPDAPSSVRASTNGSYVTVSWSSVSGATGYKVYRSSSASGTYVQVTTTYTTTYSDNFSGIATAGATYYYKVTAYSPSGESSKSSSSSVTFPPGAPSNVYAATASTEGTINVSWYSVSGATGYNVYRSTSPSGSYSLVTSTSSTSYINSGLSSSTTYYYKVSAKNSGGEGPLYSSYAYATTKTTPPGSAPTGVSASVSSSGSITVSWYSVPGATEYYVYRSTSASGTYEYVTSTSSTSYTNTGLSSSTTYYYKVKARNSAGESDLSSYVSATTGMVAPSAPSYVNAYSESSSSITVEWNSVSGATNYYVYRSTSYSGSYSQVGSTSLTSYLNTGLSASTTYYYKVIASNSAGNSQMSTAYGYATTGQAPPSAPTGVSAYAESASSITVSWYSVSGATGYNVFRSSSASGTYNQVGTTSTTSYTNTGLSSNTTYYYKVEAYNSAGKSPLSATPASAKTDLAAPEAPSSVWATESSNSIVIGWSQVSGATGYRIYRSTDASGSYSLVTSTSSMTYTNTGLSWGTTYYYKVAAYNSAGDSPLSPYGYATTNLAHTVGTFSDTRNGKTYKTVRIGRLTWMAENLNYATGNYWRYDDDAYYSDTIKYGMLYDWETAKKACPTGGWRLPTSQDWDELIADSPVAGKKLKSVTYWYREPDMEGKDEYEFNALPSGIRREDGSFDEAGYYSYWWEATENGDEDAYYRNMSYNRIDVEGYTMLKGNGLSVRCVKD